MSDHLDDETQFWDKPEWIPTGQTPRVQRDRTGGFERTRSHRIVRKDDPQPVGRTPDAVPFKVVSFDDFAPEDDDVWDDVDHWVEPLEETPRRVGFVGVDPVLLRIGAAGLVGVLMIPIALAMRDDDGGGADGVLSDEGAEVVAGTVAPALPADPTTTVITVPVTAAAPAPAPTVTTPAAAPSNASASRASQGIAAAPAAAAPAEPECAGTYTVIANDFWNRFPRSSGATVQEWLNANNATADTPLYVGDELCIPEGATAPAPPPTTQPPTTTAAPTTTQAPATTQPPTTTAPAPVVTPAPTTTRAPAPPPPAVVAPSPPAGATDKASVEALIREIWPDELEERALTIAKRESGLNPSVHNYCCYGVFAIYFEMGRNFLPQMGITSAEQLFDARTNITAAYKLYTLAGWKPWVQTDPGS